MIIVFALFDSEGGRTFIDDHAATSRAQAETIIIKRSHESVLSAVVDLWTQMRTI